MRLLVAMLAVLVAFAPLVPSAVADGAEAGEDSGGDGTQQGCRISTQDPTNPRIHGDCIIWGSSVGVGDTMASDSAWATANVTIVTPATIDCDALCDRMIEASLDLQTHSGDDAPTDSGDVHAPLGAYVSANLDVPQGEAAAGLDEGGVFTSTIVTPFQRA